MTDNRIIVGPAVAQQLREELGDDFSMYCLESEPFVPLPEVTGATMARCHELFLLSKLSIID